MGEWRNQVLPHLCAAAFPWNATGAIVAARRNRLSGEVIAGLCPAGSLIRPPAGVSFNVKAPSASGKVVLHDGNVALASRNVTLSIDNATLSTAEMTLSTDNVTLSTDNATLSTAETTLSTDNAALSTAETTLSIDNTTLASSKMALPAGKAAKSMV
jgi:hypothetical protein